MTAWRRHGPAAAAYLVLTGIVLWPAVAHFRTRPLIGTADSSVFWWAWWALPDAIGEGRNPWASDGLFHPVGLDLSMTTTAPLVALVTAPVRLLFGPVAQVNAAQLGATFAAAICCYLLAHRLGAGRGPSFVAGCAFAFTPFRFVHLSDHLNLTHTAFLPLAGLAALAWLDDQTRWRAAAVGAVVGLAFCTDPQLAVFAGVVVAVVVIVRRRDLRVPRQLALLAGTALVVAAPLLVPMAAALADGETKTFPPSALVPFSSDVLRWVVPPVSHPVLGGAAEAISGRPADEGLAYPGLLVLGLALASASLVPRADRRPWAVLAGVGFVLSLGPFLSVDGSYVPVPLPFLGVTVVPGLDSLRVPGRFAIVGVLGVVLLAALALDRLARRQGQRGRWLVAAAAAVVLFEMWPGALRHRPGDVPAPYEAIAADDGGGAVLEVPLQWSTGEVVIGDQVEPRNNSIFLVYATVHGRPLVNGSASRYPDRRLDELLATPVYRQVLALQGDEGFDDRATFDASDLTDLGIGYVVYHRDRPQPLVLEHIEGLGLPVLADDGTVIVWRVEG